MQQPRTVLQPNGRTHPGVAAESGAQTGIAFEDFAAFVNGQHDRLPSLTPGSYALAHRVISVADDGGLSVTAVSGKPAGQSLLLRDGPIRQPGWPPAELDSSPAPGRTPRGSFRGSRGAFASDVECSGTPADQDMAALIGVADSGLQSILQHDAGDFFERRALFRKRMRARMVKYMQEEVVVTHELDLPGYWTRPKMTEPYKSLLEESFQMVCLMPNGEEEELSCSATDRMVDILEDVYARYEDAMDAAPKR